MLKTVVNSLPLVTGIISIILSIVVLGAHRRVRSQRPFILFSFATGVWSIAISLFLLTEQKASAVLFATVYYVAALLLIYGFLVFALSFMRYGRDRAHLTRVARLLSVPIILLVITVLVPGGLINDVDIASSNTVLLNFGFYILYVTVFLAYGLGSLFLLLFQLGSRKKRSILERSQIRLITTVMLVCLPAGALFNLILPLLGNYTLIAIGPLFTIPITTVVFYTIMKYGLFDIRAAFIRTLVYSLSFSVIAAVYVFSIYSLSALVQTSLSGNEHLIFDLCIMFLLALSFNPLRRFFDRITNHFFYRDNYSTSEFYARLSRLLSSTTDLRGLLRQAANETAVTLKAEYGLFFVYDDYRYVMTGTADSRRRLPVQDARIIDDYVEQHGDRVIITDLLADHDKLRRLLVSHKVCLVLPLQRGDDVIIGYLLLGDHLSSSYTRRDIRALETIADELVIAIQNALSVQEVKELNATLQQRIDEATKELRASNAQLQRLDEAKDEFVSMASHQLRTPLTSVKGYIDMVLEGDAGKISDMQKHLLGEAFTSSERMVHLINDFLNVSRLQTGKFMIDRRPVDLGTIVRQEVDGLKTTAAQRQLKLTYKMPTSFPQLYIDEGKMRQVVMNFIDNAIYYSKEDTIITVALTVDGDVATMTVKDSGIGVPEDEQAQLFTKFYRASNARKQRPDGTGVGLYLAKKVVVAHGGSMVFHSTPGKGSTFGFTLPIKKLALAPASDADDLNN